MGRKKLRNLSESKEKHSKSETMRCCKLTQAEFIKDISLNT